MKSNWRLKDFFSSSNVVNGCIRETNDIAK